MGKLGCVASTAWLRSRRHSPGTHLGVYELRSFERSIPVFRLGVTAADNSRNSYFLAPFIGHLTADWIRIFT